MPPQRPGILLASALVILTQKIAYAGREGGKLAFQAAFPKRIVSSRRGHRLTRQDYWGRCPQPPEKSQAHRLSSPRRGAAKRSGAWRGILLPFFYSCDRGSSWQDGSCATTPPARFGASLLAGKRHRRVHFCKLRLSVRSAEGFKCKKGREPAMFPTQTDQKKGSSFDRG